MDTAYKPPNHHKRREQAAEGIDGISGFPILNQTLELHHGSWQDTHGKHGCGRWVGCFQNAVYQNRPAIDYMKLKKHISAEYEDVKYTKNQDAAVNLQNVFSFNPLYQPKDCKPKGYEDCHDTCPIGDVVKRHVYTKQIMDGIIDTCVRNGRTVWAYRLYIKKCQ